MSDNPWLTIVGLGEDGPDGLAPASLKALSEAEVVMGAARHLSLLPDLRCETIVWPVPFADGVPILMQQRGRKTVVLASGDPFWHGAGGSLTKLLDAGEWRSLPAPSTMALAAAVLGWPLEQTLTMGLHAAPFARLRPHLATGERAIVTLRDGAAVADFAAWLSDIGFGPSDLTVLEALGGPRARIRHTTANAMTLTEIAHPVSVALDAKGTDALPQASGRPDQFFDNDGQITKRPIRALTLSALAPLPGEHLWDIGGGSGSIAIEWLLAHPRTEATSVEINPERAARIRTNAANLGVDRLTVVTGAAPEALEGLAQPDAVFIGGGVSEGMLQTVWQNMPQGARLVANAVTLEAEVLLANWHSAHGGELLRIELAHANPLGRKRGWKSSYPIVQWSVIK
ncbi:bifunctional cobalt-precorrin-7 (C(5))-methyltransferase/cobalt-precorrin-6B (C(15))-methyltransferase [Shimia marina]|uniref:Precorrin-6Y C(5,15)-methyltransferase [decarboxylating] n=1 Tax=Shimia marina TaxID=321267 RepID=A0A0N7LSB9_9RHOB|nr:bifunctional cobalt-precorrin-7 (C(5))-methyltransferase/cobalt-precorrin-6B (C(15))-methyltransferase [Shimia marina]CUH53188.1 Precorrin-6Y C(5,15)-methyltransferase [decarboxylating] [Shimia marina]SFD82794.1 precorrin-6Y C5,15-methyltransferase (decarboxylating) [Shimia marina]